MSKGKKKQLADAIRQQERSGETPDAEGRPASPIDRPTMRFSFEDSAAMVSPLGLKLQEAVVKINMKGEDFIVRPAEKPATTAAERVADFIGEIYDVTFALLYSRDDPEQPDQPLLPVIGVHPASNRDPWEIVFWPVSVDKLNEDKDWEPEDFDIDRFDQISRFFRDIEKLSLRGVSIIERPGGHFKLLAKNPVKLIDVLEKLCIAKGLHTLDTLVMGQYLEADAVSKTLKAEKDSLSTAEASRFTPPAGKKDEHCAYLREAVSAKLIKCQGRQADNPEGLIENVMPQTFVSAAHASFNAVAIEQLSLYGCSFQQVKQTIETELKLPKTARVNPLLQFH